MRLILALVGSAFVTGAMAEDFEALPAGPLGVLDTSVGTWRAAKGHAEIHDEHARGGKQSLRLLGGEKHAVELQLKRSIATDVELAFWAERWTKRAPFSFRIEAKRSGKWSEIYDGDKTLRVGASFLSNVHVPVAKGVEALRFSSTTPPKSGVMIDDLELGAVVPMTVVKTTAIQPVIPVLIRKKVNPVLGLLVVTEGRGAPCSVTGIRLNLEGTTNPKDVKAVQVLAAGGERTAGAGEPFASARPPGKEMAFKGKTVLTGGENYFWISVELREGASLDGVVDATILEVEIDGSQRLLPEKSTPRSPQRIGYAVRQRGDDGSRGFRIPGLATTNKGTLIGVYDVRRRGGGDLPGDIDVGMSRSTNGGEGWEPMKVIMDMGDNPKWRYDGIGDPAVLVDRGSGRVWVIATWSHGNRSWIGSGQGMTPEETGQLMLVYSEDDGVTWSKPINITKQVKKPDWHFLLQGPGNGITMKDGTIVFAAQYQDRDKKPDGSKKGTPYSSLIYSKDHGKTWHMGTGIKSDTTESQIVELGDGSLMLNCRDNRGGARTIGITKDLGKTWTLHPTDRKALREPVCMASLIRVEHPEHGNILVFSNPNTTRGRYNMTIKVSKDEGKTWPENSHTLYDARMGSGYSCLTHIGQDKIGVLYEGPTEIYFLRFSLNELVK